jgi:hypothetical protein
MNDQAPRFHSESTPEIEGYQPLDRGAIAAFLLSLLSPLSLVLPIAAVLSIPTVILALLALRRLRASSETGAGVWISRFALIAAAIFAGWGTVSHLAMRAHLSSQARQTFEQWVGYLAEGKRYEAYELHLQYQQRQLPGVSLEEMYTKDLEMDMQKMAAETNDPREIVRMQMSRPANNPKMQFDTFFMSDPMKSLADHAVDGKLAYQGMQSVEWSGPDVEMLLRFQLSFADGGVERQMPFAVRMRRSRYTGGEYHWMVDEVLRVSRSE